MSWNALDGVAVVVERETLGSERNTLIQFHVVADDACGAYHHTRSVVNGEVVADGGGWMNVDARLRVGHLCDYSRNEWHSQFHQFVCYAVVGESLDYGIARYYLAKTLCRRVTVISSLHVGGENLAYLRHAVDE